MARAREKERGDKGIERQQVTSPYVRHKPLLRERGGTCSLPEVGGGGRISLGRIEYGHVLARIN